MRLRRAIPATLVLLLAAESGVSAASVGPAKPKSSASNASSSVLFVGKRESNLEINRCRAMAGAGTSADAQLAVFEAHAESQGREAALRAVSEWIAAATLQ